MHAAFPLPGPCELSDSERSRTPARAVLFPSRMSQRPPPLPLAPLLPAGSAIARSIVSNCAR